MCHKSIHQLGRAVFTIVENLYGTVYPLFCVALIVCHFKASIHLNDCFVDSYGGTEPISPATQNNLI